MSRRFGLLLLALPLLLLLVLAATGGLREALVLPLLYLFWLMGVLFQSLPQVLVWGAFVAVAAVAGWRSLARPRAGLPRLAAPAGPGRAVIAEWAGLVANAPANHYARWLLASRLAQLAVALLAGEEASPWQYLEGASLAMPDDVRSYLRAGRQSYQPPAPRRLWARASRVAQPDPLELDPVIVIDFFEQSLHKTIGAAYEPGRD